MLHGFESQVFEQQWEDEFAQVTFQPELVRLASIIGVCNCIVHFFIFHKELEDAGASLLWRWMTFVPFTMCFLLYLALLFLLKMGPKAGGVTFRHRNTMRMAIFIPVIPFLVYQKVFLEWQRSFEGSRNPAYKNLNISYSFSNLLPERTCHDSDPATTWKSGTITDHSFGCENLALSAEETCLYLAGNMFPLLTLMSLRSTVLANLLMFSSYIFAFVLGGTGCLHLGVLATCQLVCNICCVLLCRMRRAQERRSFAVKKIVQNLCDENRNLLHTLMPADVARKLIEQEDKAGGSVAFLGTAIAHCVVMFCSLEPQRRLREMVDEATLALLHEVARMHARTHAHVCTESHSHAYTTSPAPRPNTPLSPSSLPQPRRRLCTGPPPVVGILFSRYASLRRETQ